MLDALEAFIDGKYVFDKTNFNKFDKVFIYIKIK